MQDAAIRYAGGHAVDFDQEAAALATRPQQAGAVPANQSSAEAHEPLFWYRPCGDGLYEGPVYHKSVGGKMLRDEKPGEWVPLFPGAQPQPKSTQEPYGFESGLVQLLNEARCLSKETVGNRELAGRVMKYIRMYWDTAAQAPAPGAGKPVAWMYEHDGCHDEPILTISRWPECSGPWNETPLDALALAKHAIEKVWFDAVGVGNGEHSISEAARTRVEFAADALKLGLRLPSALRKTEVETPISQPQTTVAMVEPAAYLTEQDDGQIMLWTPDDLCEARTYCEDGVEPTPLYLVPAQAPAVVDGKAPTYSSTQATKCAGCGKHKHTPLRIDAMGGYVCLTCIDKKLGGLLGEFGCEDDPQRKDAERYRWLRSDEIEVPASQREINVVRAAMPFREDQQDETLFGDALDAAIDVAMGESDVPVHHMGEKP
ncbi:hypothetical protein J7U46_09755 [Pelomonas sp. V22]|uniref:hypothetical protein n=1 Tax=Pelomonas sp. V22 TaxID=2822139 RepID=UPI0024A86DB2|nr:hypothetical protein [Pelomonas sp. V22]MDI4633331.1 hypothetical protein [Pelomonas sp. V22]